MNKITYLVAALLFSLIATPVQASLAWSSAMEFSVESGFENPVILFGFNPQPEPPPGMTTTGIYDPARATQELSGIEPTPFIIYVAAEGGEFAFPPEPVIDFDQLNVDFVTTGGQALSLQFSLSETGDGDASSGISDPLFFNPQPEPPPQFTDSLAFQFAFNNLEGVDSVAVSLQVLNEAGDALPIKAVPVPPSVWLMVSGLLGIAGIARRRSAVTRLRV